MSAGGDSNFSRFLTFIGLLYVAGIAGILSTTLPPSEGLFGDAGGAWVMTVLFVVIAAIPVVLLFLVVYHPTNIPIELPRDDWIALRGAALRYAEASSGPMTRGQQDLDQAAKAIGYALYQHRPLDLDAEPALPPITFAERDLPPQRMEDTLVEDDSSQRIVEPKVPPAGNSDSHQFYAYLAMADPVRLLKQRRDDCLRAADEADENDEHVLRDAYNRVAKDLDGKAHAEASRRDPEVWVSMKASAWRAVAAVTESEAFALRESEEERGFDPNAADSDSGQLMQASERISRAIETGRKGGG